MGANRPLYAQNFDGDDYHAHGYLKMDGAKVVPGHSGTTQGQIVVLQQAPYGIR
jgi:hypothetical protein